VNDDSVGMQGDQLAAHDVAVLLRAARAAPSIHNTQPWLFAARAGRIDVWADRRRALAAIDSDGRQRTISCGAAVFNLRLAMAQLGYRPATALCPQPDEPELLATVAAAEPAPPERRRQHALPADLRFGQSGRLAARRAGAAAGAAHRYREWSCGLLPQPGDRGTGPAGRARQPAAVRWPTADAATRRLRIDPYPADRPPRRSRHILTRAAPDRCGPRPVQHLFGPPRPSSPTVDRRERWRSGPPLRSRVSQPGQRDRRALELLDDTSVHRAARR
jgi:nitroreductase